MPVEPPPPVAFGVNYTPRRGWFHAWLDLDEVCADLFNLRLAHAASISRHRPILDQRLRSVQLAGWLHYYNHHRPHTACGNQPPLSRLTNVPDQYT